MRPCEGATGPGDRPASKTGRRPCLPRTAGRGATLTTANRSLTIPETPAAPPCVVAAENRSARLADRRRRHVRHISEPGAIKVVCGHSMGTPLPRCGGTGDGRPIPPGVKPTTDAEEGTPAAAGRSRMVGTRPTLPRSAPNDSHPRRPRDGALIPPVVRRHRKGQEHRADEQASEEGNREVVPGNHRRLRSTPGGTRRALPSRRVPRWAWGEQGKRGEGERGRGWVTIRNP